MNRRPMAMILAAFAIFGTAVFLTLAVGAELNGVGLGVGVPVPTSPAGGAFPPPAVPAQFPTSLPLPSGSSAVTAEARTGGAMTVSWRTKTAPDQVVKFYAGLSGGWAVVQRRNAPLGTEFDLRGPGTGQTATVDVAAQAADGYARYSVTMDPPAEPALAAGVLPPDLGPARVSALIPWPEAAQARVWKAEEDSGRALAVFLTDAAPSVAENAELAAATDAGWSVAKRQQYATGELVTLTKSGQQLQFAAESSAFWAGESQLTVVEGPK